MNKLRLFSLVILSTLVCANVFAIGIIIPERIEPRVELKPLTIIRQEVVVNIKNDVARTHITQVFYNHYPHQLEATYIFPVPPEAQITDFVMYIEGKPVRGEIMEKNQARAIYEDIVRKMRDPALLEYYDWQLFKMRIFPVPPRGKQKIEIEYVQVLKVDNNVVHYSFPLSKRDFAEVNTEDLKEWTFTVNIQSDRKIKTIYSPAYELKVDMREDQQSAQIKVLPEELQKSGNNVDIYYTYSTAEYGLNILAHRPYADEPGYFLLIISPGKFKPAEVVIPKDIIFVVDTSGSMAGEKIEQVKKTVKYCLNSLSKNDRFNIVSFSTDVQSLSEKLLVAQGENLSRAIDFTEALQARGGTNINEALMTALKLLGDDKSETESQTSIKRLKQILFLTDGLPTVGVTNPNQILENIEKMRKQNLRIFVFGVGYDVNTKLLDGIAQRTRALTTYIQPAEDIEVKVSSLYDKISQPVLTDLQIDFGKIEVSEVYPGELPDLFAGAEVTVVGKYKNAGHTTISLRGTVGSEHKRFVYECDFPERERGNEFIENLWAGRKIGYLLEAIRGMGETQAEARELIDEVIRLSKKYGIVTPYTSYLIQEDTSAPQRVELREPQFSQRDAWPAHKGAPVPGSSSPHAMAMMKAETGKEAIQQSIAIKELKESARVEKAEIGQKLVTVKGKTFTFQKNVWVDSELKEQEAQILKIKYLSSAYFELLKLRPELSDFLRLGDKIKIQLTDKLILEISNEGIESLTDEQRSLLKKK